MRQDEKDTQGPAAPAIVITGEGIGLYRLMALRSAVKLEGVGLKMRGGSVTARVKRELGLPKGTKREAVLAALTVAIEAQATQLKPGDIRPA
jgi:hypothetical protein